jgi:hypothetical protein
MILLGWPILLVLLLGFVEDWAAPPLAVETGDFGEPCGWCC